MAIVKGKLKTESGDTLYPETSVDKIIGAGGAAAKGVATAISSSSTDDDLATAKAVNDAISALPQSSEYAVKNADNEFSASQTIGGYVKSTAYSSLAGGSNRPAFIFDKAGSYWTGIGAHTTANTIWFGAVDPTEATWIDNLQQIWNFNGTITQQGKPVANYEDTEKALYNLGAFDSVTDNGDGTVTITRQTGYIKSPSLAQYVTSEYYTNVWWAAFPKPVDAYDYGNYTTNVVGSVPLISDPEEMDTAANIGKVTGNGQAVNYWVGLTPNAFSSQDAQAYLCANVSLEYKLAAAYAYTEKVLKGHPITTLDRQGEEWLRDEWEKGLNLLNPAVFTSTNEAAISRLSYWVNSDGSLSINTTDSNDPYVYFSNCFTLNERTTVTLSSDNYSNIQMLGITTNGTTNFIGYTADSPLTLTLPAGTYGIGIETYTTGGSNYLLMLNVGDRAYRFRPYCGSIAHAGVANQFTEAQKIKSGQTDLVLELQSNHSNNCSIAFRNKDGYILGLLGFQGTNTPKYWDSTGNTARRLMPTSSGNVTDFNSMLSHGFYSFNDGVANAPKSGWGTLQVIVNDGGEHNNDNNWIWQIAYFTSSSTEVYIRSKVNNGNWTGWYKQAFSNEATKLYQHSISFRDYPSITELKLSSNGVSANTISVAYGMKEIKFVSTQNSQLGLSDFTSSILGFKSAVFGSSNYHLIKCIGASSGTPDTLRFLAAKEDTWSSVYLHIVTFTFAYSNYTVTEI